MATKIIAEIGKYEAGRLYEVEVPDHSLNSANLALNKAQEEVDRLIELGEFDEWSYVSQLKTPNHKILYDYMNGFAIYYPELMKGGRK